MKIQVNSEWGNLKECVFGQMHDFIFPEWTDQYETIVTPDLKQYVKDNAGKRRSEFEPEGHAKTVAQQEAVVKALEDLGVIVHRPKKLTREQETFYPISSGITQGWARDWLGVIGNNYIELAPRRLALRFDKYAFRYIAEQVIDRGGRWLAMPESPKVQDDGTDPSIPFLEGGDIFPFPDKKVLVGCNEGHTASSEAGIKWLQAALGDEYDVEHVPINGELIHLDCMLHTQREGLAVACPEGFAAGIPDYLKDWDLIEISLDDAHHLGANHLVVNEETAIVA